jgi:hypothetical protein
VASVPDESQFWLQGSNCFVHIVGKDLRGFTVDSTFLPGTALRSKRRQCLSERANELPFYRDALLHLGFGDGDARLERFRCCLDPASDSDAGR